MRIGNYTRQSKSVICPNGPAPVEERFGDYDGETATPHDSPPAQCDQPGF